MDRVLGREKLDTTLAESSVTIRLLTIQERCKELLDDPGDSLELSLEEPSTGFNRGINPYESA